MLPTPGQLLLAEPFMDDVYFNRTTILCCDIAATGAMGLVLNQPLKASINDLFDDLPPFNARFFEGGPVEQNSLFFIHKIPFISNSVNLCEGVYEGGDFEEIKKLIANRKILSNQILFYVGCAVWDTGQLQEEMNDNSWVVANPTKELLFHPEVGTLWRRSMASLGGKYIALANAPVSPRFN